MVEQKSKDEWEEHLKDQREKLLDLVLDENEELVSRETLHERLKEIDVVVETDDSGTTHYRDTSVREQDERSESEEPSEPNTVTYPVSRADMLVRLGKHPHDELEPVEQEAERMAELDRHVTPVFEEQAENGDFPLEYPPRKDDTED